MHCRLTVTRSAGDLHKMNIFQITGPQSTRGVSKFRVFMSLYCKLLTKESHIKVSRGEKTHLGAIKMHNKIKFTPMPSVTI